MSITNAPQFSAAEQCALRTFVSTVPTAMNRIKPTPLSDTKKRTNPNNSTVPRMSTHSAEEIAPDDGSENYECCLVRVLRIVVRDGTMGLYKTIKVKQEVGYWLRTFRFNLFYSHPLYTTIKEDMQLDIKVNLVIIYIIFHVNLRC